MRHRALDGWRGAGALAVVTLHYKASGFFPDLPPLDCLSLAVDFFFVLSGFVIARTYTAELDKGGNVLAFAIRRFGRLWPLHASLLAVLIAIELVASIRGGLSSGLPPFSDIRAPAMILPNLLLVQPFLSPSELTWNYSSWSISAEFWTYLVFALLVVASRPLRRGRVAMFTCLAVAAWGAVLVWAPDGMETTGYLAIARCLTGFFAGVIAETLFRTDAVRRLSLGHFEILAAASAVSLIVAAAMLPNARFAAPVVFSFLVLAYAGDRGPISMVLCTRPVQWLGKLSYSIYMTHALLLIHVTQKVVNAVARLVGDHLLLVELILPVVFFILLICTSLVTYLVIEMPCQKMFASFAGRLARTTPMPASATGDGHAL